MATSYNITLSQEQIESRVRTRGLGGGDPLDKRFGAMSCALLTWNPSVTVRTRTDDQTDWLATAWTDVTRDNSKFIRPAGTADYQHDNSGDNHAAPWREDYHLTIPAGGLEPGSNGLDPDKLAELKVDTSVHRRGRWLMVEVGTTQGRMSVNSVGVDYRTGQRPTHERRD